LSEIASIPPYSRGMDGPPRDDLGVRAVVMGSKGSLAGYGEEQAPVFAHGRIPSAVARQFLGAVG